MARKHRPTEEVPIDKVEHFLENNFSKILMAVAGIILLFLIVFMVQKNMQTKTAIKYNALGEYEVYLLAGTADDAKVNEFIAAGSEISDMTDYVNYKVALYYLKKGDTQSAIKMLKKTGGIYSELKDSLLFDLGESSTVPSAYLSGAFYSSIWDYRKIMQMTDVVSKRKAIDEFKTSHEDSRLVEWLNNWE